MWSRKYKHCRKCKTTSIKHNARGLCRKCYKRKYGTKNTTEYNKQYYQLHKAERVEYKKKYYLEHKSDLDKYNQEWHRKKRAAVKAKKLKKREANKLYREKNRDKLNAYKKKYNKIYREQNKDKLKKYRKKYTEANKKKIDATRKKYLERNKEKIKKRAALYYKNKKLGNSNNSNKVRSQ
jgi:hypothetical protein